MDPVIFEFLGGLLVGAFAGLMVVLRSKHPTPKIIPMLTLRTPRLSSSTRGRRSSSPKGKGRTTVSVARTRRKAKNKTLDATSAPSQIPNTTLATTVSFDTCPSCGLQAPGALLTEHFLSSPSHRNGPPKTAEADPAEAEEVAEGEEEDSRQSVRNLLQMLVPPRAFGRRHAFKSVSPISSIVKNLGPASGRTRGP